MRFDDLITQAEAYAAKGATHLMVPIELLKKIDVALDAGVMFAGNDCVHEKGAEKTYAPHPGCGCNVCIARKTLADVGIFPSEELTPPYAHIPPQT